MNMTPSTPLTRLCAAAVCLSGIPSIVLAQGTPPATIATKTTGLERREGFLPFYLDGRTGKLLLEIPRDSTRALLLISQATGLGSNPIGVDRGASDASYVVRFDRDADRVRALLETWKARSSALDNAAHQRSSGEPFPASTMAAMPLVAEEGG